MEINKLCLQCHSSILPKYLGDREYLRKKFCSCSCAATYNNRTGRITKRRVEGKCITCSKPIHKHLRYCCKKCRAQDGNFGSRKKSEVSRVKLCWHARLILESNDIEKCCYVCGYSFHVQCCHIKAVSDFMPNTKVSTINALENLIYLCPNHHIEFDRGALKLGTPTRIRT